MLAKTALSLAPLLIAASCASPSAPTTPPPIAPSPPAPTQDPEPTAAAQPPAPAEAAWTWSLEGYAYSVANGGDYVLTIAQLDRGPLHLEARYNYEDIETASLWAGVNFEWGDEVTLELTPMFGVVFGNTTGIAPGVEATLGYGIFELYTEAEYVIDTRDDSTDYFYSWTEAIVSPTKELRAGLVAQRTKAFQSDSDVQGGFLVGVTVKRFDATAYVFNVGWDDPSFMFSVGFAF